MYPESPTAGYAMSMSSATAKSTAIGYTNNARNANEEGYTNDQMTPTYEIPFSSLADDGEYLQATPATGIPMDQMAGKNDYENVNMAPENGIPFNHKAGNGEYLHTAPVAGIPKDQTADNGDYVNANMTSKGQNVENA